MIVGIASSDGGPWARRVAGSAPTTAEDIDMRAWILLALGLASAGCNQTLGTATARPSGTEGAATDAAPARQSSKQSAKQVAAAQTVAQRCADAAQEMANKQTQAAMLGGALSMVGGIGGMGGEGGAVAAQAASVGGSLIQSQASAQAEAAMTQECR
jgi:secreted effector protein SseD